MGDDTICHKDNESITMRSIPNFEISFVYRFVYFLSTDAARSTARRREGDAGIFVVVFVDSGKGRVGPTIVTKRKCII